MKSIFFLLFFATSIMAFSQSAGIQWINRFGGSSDDKFYGITQLTDGNYVCAGTTMSNDGDISGNHGGIDFLLACFTPQGQLLWKKLIGGSLDDGSNFVLRPVSVVATQEGGFYFAGISQSGDGDIGMNKGWLDVFVSKHDANGNIIWKKVLGGTNGENVTSIITTPDGGCVFAGAASSSNSGDIGATRGGLDSWIVKLSPLGVIEWSKFYGGSQNDQADNIKRTTDGGYIFTSSTSSIDGDLAGTVPAGEVRKSDVWVVKIAANGDIQWHRRIGASDDEDGGYIVQAPSGEYFVAFSSRSTDGEFGGNMGLYDMMMIKLSSSGSTVFMRRYAGYAWDWVSDLLEAPDGNPIIVGGSYSNFINSNTIPWGHLSDIALFKVNKISGDIHWFTSMGGNEAEIAPQVHISPEGDFYLAGLSNSMDRDFLYPKGGADAILVKLGTRNAIRGQVYMDQNANGTKESYEQVIDNIYVQSSKANGYSVATYSYNGLYANEVDTGTFITKPVVYNSEFYTFAPDSFSTSFSNFYGTVTRNIGFRPIAGKRDLRGIIVPLSPSRPGFDVFYKVICYNSGTDTVASGSVRLIKDARTTLVSSTPAGVQSSDTLTWQFSNFKPFDTLAFNIVLKGNLPPWLQGGEWTKFQVLVSPVAGDLKPADNDYTLFHRVTGSYDPNDKQESHGERYSSRELDAKSFLNYTIRFQNTGSDTAFKVVVIDTLDQKLDKNTFEFLASSHPAQLKVNGNIYTWTFHPIFLPDSNVNERGSHGFITYRIKPSSSVRLNDTISNSASIYFDYNLPIKTNTFQTIIKLPIPPQPALTDITYMCASAAPKKVKILNIPPADYQVSVSVKVGNTVLPVATDSTFTLDPAQLGPGENILNVSFINSTATLSTTKILRVPPTVTPLVDLASNVLSISSGTDTVKLTASNIEGGGTAPQYSFSRTRTFSSLIAGPGTSPFLSLPGQTLNFGDNWFYVKMKTSDTCFTVETSIDSIRVRRDQLTSILDPSNSSFQIKAMPNPYRDHITLTGFDPQKTTIVCAYDMLGRLILSKTVKGQTSISITTLPPGGITLLLFRNEKGRNIGAIRLAGAN